MSKDDDQIILDDLTVLSSVDETELDDAVMHIDNVKDIERPDDTLMNIHMGTDILSTDREEDAIVDGVYVGEATLVFDDISYEIDDITVIPHDYEMSIDDLLFNLDVQPQSDMILISENSAEPVSIEEIAQNIREQLRDEPDNAVQDPFVEPVVIEEVFTDQTVVNTDTAVVEPSVGDLVGTVEIPVVNEPVEPENSVDVPDESADPDVVPVPDEPVDEPSEPDPVPEEPPVVIPPVDPEPEIPVEPPVEEESEVPEEPSDSEPPVEEESEVPEEPSDSEPPVEEESEVPEEPSDSEPPVEEPEDPVEPPVEDETDEQGNNGGQHPNNGHGNGDQDAPGNSGDHNNAENGDDNDKGNDKEKHPNNGHGNGDQDAPGNSGDHNNAENASDDVVDDEKEFRPNNGHGNGDQDAPGNSGPNNNAENAEDDHDDLFVFDREEKSNNGKSGWVGETENDTEMMNSSDGGWTSIENDHHGKGKGKGGFDEDDYASAQHNDDTSSNDVFDFGGGEDLLW